MRNRFLMSGATMAATVIIASVLAAAVVEDDYDERLDDLEDRVTRLEEEAGIRGSESTRAGTEGEDGEEGSSVSVSTDSSSASVSSSSTSSSTSGQAGAYNASYASSSSQDMEFELSNPGTYRLTVAPGAAFLLRVETGAGEVIPAFSLEGDGSETLTAEGTLEPGAYVLRVETTAQWAVDITLIGE